MKTWKKAARALSLVMAFAVALTSGVMASGEPGHPEYAEENETAQKGGIVLTGSSLMEHFPIGDILEENGDDYVIYNRGYGGYVMTQLMEVMDTAVFDLVPSALFINIGTNDIDRLSEEYTYEDMMENYRTILTSVREHLPGCAIYVMAYYPCTPNTGVGQIQRTLEQLDEANAYVEALAAELGVNFLNVNAVLEREDGYLKDEYAADSIHLTKEAYQAIYKALKPYFDECEASPLYLDPDAVLSAYGGPSGEASGAPSGEASTVPSGELSGRR